MLCAKVHEIDLTVDNFDCQLCPIEFAKMLRKGVPGISHVQAWEPEGLAVAIWKNSGPFQTFLFYRALADSKFLIRDITIDVDGTISSKLCSMHLSSLPEKSLFIIDNRQDFLLDNVKNGDFIRCKGRVSNQQGFNFLTVTKIISHTPAKEKAADATTTGEKK